MHPLLEEYEALKPTFEILEKIVLSALQSPPSELEKEWLKCTEPPHVNGMMRKFTAPDLRTEKDDQTYLGTAGMTFTYDVIKFQTAEMYRMEGKQLDNPNRYFGLQSDAGFDWYNFTALSVIECGIACAIDNKDDFTNMDWAIIGRLLEDGRIYE